MDNMTNEEALVILVNTDFYQKKVLENGRDEAYGEGVGPLNDSIEQALQIAIQCLKDKIKTEG